MVEVPGGVHPGRENSRAAGGEGAGGRALHFHQQPAPGHPREEGRPGGGVRGGPARPARLRGVHLPLPAGEPGLRGLRVGPPQPQRRRLRGGGGGRDRLLRVHGLHGGQRQLPQPDPGPAGRDDPHHAGVPEGPQARRRPAHGRIRRRVPVQAGRARPGAGPGPPVLLVLKTVSPPSMRAATVLAALALCAGCVHHPTEKEQRVSENHFDLGVMAQEKGNIQEALREYESALEADEGFPEAHNAIGILLHLSFKRYEEAIQHYKRALEIRPGYSEAKTNLGNVYLDMGKYDPAIDLYDQALNDMHYTTPYIAHANRGWAQYKRGNVREGVESIQTALTINPRFCLGYKQLGLIHNEQGQFDAACDDFRHFRDGCPDAGEAYYLEGKCLAKLGKTDEALKDFAACQTKS